MKDNYTPDEQREHRQMLAQALRSGEYKQDQLALRTNRGYCCLGVGCDVMRKETGVGEWEVTQDGYRFIAHGCYTWEVEEEHLPPSAQRFYGLHRESYYVDPVTGESRSLVGDNDAGCTFEEIAATIESEPEWFSNICGTS